MKMLIDDLQLQEPSAAFNGGLFVRPDLSVIRGHLLPREVVQRVIDILTRSRLINGSPQVRDRSSGVNTLDFLVPYCRGL